MAVDRGIKNATAEEMLEEKGLRLKSNIGLDGILENAKEILERAEDFKVLEKDITSIADSGYKLQIDKEDYVSSDWAINYICTTHNIPKTFLNKTLNKAALTEHKPLSDLVNQTLNVYMQSPSKSSREWLIRVLDENYIRAIRSANRFHVRDNYPLLNSCIETLKTHYTLSSGVIDEDVMILRLYLNESFKVKINKDKDGKAEEKTVKIGVQMKNSETGYYSLQLKVLVNISDEKNKAGNEFTSAILLNMRHNAKAITSVDINDYLLALATEKKKEIFNQIKDLIAHDDLDNKSFQNFLDRLKSIINKKEYDMLVELSPRAKKSALSSNVLDIVKDYDFVKKERVENLINDAFYKIFMSMKVEESSYDEIESE